MQNKVKKTLREFTANTRILKNPYKGLVLSSVLLSVASLAVMAYSYRLLPVEGIVLRFNGAEGVREIGERWNMLGIVGGGVGMAWINLFLAETFFSKSRICAILLLVASIILSLLTLVVAGVIVSTN
ncbi:hypothetical protein A3A21_02850 [Candidatus Jorgensenbacteria bacterium RIFCSPLOWO2_01_FULL_45_25b]|uniref:DUF1648 domain-containing protein n=1 Tax=Candidatus Jorgensenbacteria bacterium RIFCSPLOWO2_01_FULL_45_25b TaxID=1798471 RepID=A0A1F6BYU6_9BACT|nr:MAG: hypothetical protein A3A21_02850 [Candidatus Jorgensenbacteria bacterium RIFCSPLOWO2_01_FULL_45_25b]